MPQYEATLSVWLGQVRVGSITELGGDRSVFSFDEDYAEDADRPLLSLSFLNSSGELITDIGISKSPRAHPFFSNLLPEKGLRDYLSAQAHVKSVRDLPLLRMLGDDLPGAVVVRAESEGPPEQESGELPETNMMGDGPLKFSLAGVQMKLSAAGSPANGLTIPVYGRGGHWIIKVPSQQYPLLPENEHSMMTLARSAGIQTADTGLVPMADIEGLPSAFRLTHGNALWVKRFDRTESAGRVHMEDFNQVYGQFPEQKYKNYSYGNMAEDIARVAGMDALREFVRRLVFSAAIGNADMHLKNWSLLYADGRTPELSPAYDMVSTIAYIDDVTMALSIAREKDVRKFDVELLRHFAARAGLPEALVTETALETAENTVQAWASVRSELPIPASAAEKVTDRLRIFPLTALFLS